MMRTFKNLLLITLVTVGLAACNDGTPVTASNVPDLAIPPASQKLTLSGAVITSDASNASVSVKVGNNSYTAQTTTDATGSWSVEIDQANDTDLVMVEAFEPASGLRLMSVAGDFARVSSQAVDGQVGGIKVTAFATACLVMAKEMAADKSVDDLAEYNAALAQVGAQELVDIAGAITILADEINGITLPSGYADTLALAKDVANDSNTFLADVETMHPGTRALAVDALFNLTDAVPGFGSDDLQGVYLSENNFTLYVLYGDGSGKASFFDDDEARSVEAWEVSGIGDLEINYSTELSQFDRVRLLGDSGNILQTFQERNYGAGASGQLSAATFDFYPFEGAFDAASITGAYSLSEEDGRALVFAADGTGNRVDSAGAPGTAFTWVIGNDGRLVLNQVNGITTIIAKLGESRRQGAVLMTTIRRGGVVQDIQVRSFTRQ